MDLKPIEIVMRSGAPQLSYIRIGVYDIIPYLEDGDTPTYIAAVLGISTSAVEALMKYIDEHREEVMAVHRQIEEKASAGQLSRSRGAHSCFAHSPNDPATVEGDSRKARTGGQRCERSSVVSLSPVWVMLRRAARRQPPL